MFGVYTVKNPYEEKNAIRIDHTLIGWIFNFTQVNNSDHGFVVVGKVPHDDYGEGYFSSSGSYREDIPAFMEWMLLAYAMHDHYLADGQNDKAMSELQKAEEYLSQALDRFERIESQNQVTVNSPSAPYHTNTISQRNI